MAGPLSLIFSSANVMASDSTEVTVSMTSGNSTGYVNLSSPKLASAKYRQHRSSMPEVTVTSRNAINALAPASLGVCPDNLLNIKAESAFVQTVDIAQTLCVTIGNSQNQQGLGSLSLRHVQKNDFRTLEDVLATVEKKGSIRSATLWHGEEIGQVFGNFLFSALSLRPQASITHDEKFALGFSVFSRSTLISIFSSIPCGKRMFFNCDFLFLLPVAINISICNGFCVYTQYRKMKTKKRVDSSTHHGLRCLHTLIVSWYKNSNAQQCSNTTGASNLTVTGGNDMACSHDTQAHPKFTDTYWIVPRYETAPYGKVSFTRQDRRIFIALFKDSRLIWAGRQPVKRFTQGLKDPKSPKVGVKRSANPTMSAKGTESCRGQSVSYIVTQGGVNITSPSTITNIVTVQGVAHV